MMKIAIVGATGPTGIHLVTELRKSVATVRVIARSIDKLALGETPKGIPGKTGLGRVFGCSDLAFFVDVERGKTEQTRADNRKADDVGIFPRELGDGLREGKLAGFPFAVEVKRANIS
jgi:uncharacterized protein YbjT (DUF2867 family)